MASLWRSVTNPIPISSKDLSIWTKPVILKPYRALPKQISKVCLPRVMCRIKFTGRLLLLRAAGVWQPSMRRDTLVLKEYIDEYPSDEQGIFNAQVGSEMHPVCDD